MKFIKKTDEPSFFIEDTKELRKKIKETQKKYEIWDEYTQKRTLKEHILKNEQNYLCCYCESKVTLDDSHIEHLKPKSLDYELLTFEYSNLAVSCDGKCHTNSDKPITCGHKKENKFNEIYFLSPTLTVNIRDYFIYTEKGFIGSSSLDEKKSKYTMDILQLNTFGNYLPEARLKSLQEFRKSVKQSSEKTNTDLKTVAISLLNRENLAFISFLRFQYAKVL